MGWSLKIKYPELEDFYKIKIIIKELDTTLTGTKIEQLDYGMKNHPDLSVVTEVANDNKYLTADASKTNE